MSFDYPKKANVLVSKIVLIDGVLRCTVEGARTNFTLKFFSLNSSWIPEHIVLKGYET